MTAQVFRLPALLRQIGLAGMARTRDYHAEYRRRIERAAARGLSRSQARGHARSGEQPVRPRVSRAQDDALEAALKALRVTGSQKDAARSAKVSPERFRRFLREQNLATRRGRSWEITDNRFREMMVLTDGERRQLVISGFDQASLAGRHLAAAQRFIETNDPSLLEPFIGASVTDASGKVHALETDPNRLHRLASDGESFPDIYRLVQ